MNTSATGGYLLPEGEVVPNDQELEDILQGFIKGVTALSGQMIRPRFQTIPIAVPAVGVDWVAFGIKSVVQDDSPYIKQDAENSKSIRHEDIELFLSFYGDHGQHFAKTFIDGAAIPQNIAQLQQYKIKFIDIGGVITAPDLINSQYVHRFDVIAKFRRKTERLYQIKTFESFQININK